MRLIGSKASYILMVLLVFAAVPARASFVQTSVTASNGIAVSVYSDNFANRYEYSAPIVNANAIGSVFSTHAFALVGRVKQGGVIGAIHVQGGLTYNGKWLYYTSAVFKGGDPVDYTVTSRDVNCFTYSCGYSERFQINFSPTDVATHAENGILAIQLRSLASSEVILFEIPTTYFDAVNEVAK